VYPLANGSNTWIDATSAGNAWATSYYQDAITPGVRTWHWNGSSWQRVSVPASFAKRGVVISFAASPDGSAWIFAGLPGSKAGQIYALHGTSHGLAVNETFAAEIDTAVAPAANDVWAFSFPDSTAGKHYAMHYNGRSWTKKPFLPMVAYTATAASPSDIWVGGSGTSSNDALGHWNGSSWSYTGLPRLTVPHGDTASVTDLASAGSGSVWGLVGLTDCGSPDCAAGAILIHWTGGGWRQITIPAGLVRLSHWEGVWVEPDGSGGAWVGVSPPPNVGMALPPAPPVTVLHYSHGSWSRPSVPAGLSSVDLIPGTTSVWGSANAGIVRS
jgi:hypothetical protein